MPIPCDFAGWQSDSFTLQRAGWKFLSNQIVDHRSIGPQIEFIARLGRAALVGKWTADFLKIYTAKAEFITDMLRDSPIEFRNVIADQNAQFMFTAPARSAKTFTPLDSFVEVDMAVTMDIRSHTIESICAPVLTPTIDDIVLAPEDIPKALEMIHGAQQPKQKQISKAIAAEKARRELNGQIVVPHARIVSLAA